MLRCEVLRLEPTDVAIDRLHIALRGTVRGLQYMGPHTEYAIEVAGATIVAHSPAEFTVGNLVNVTFRPQDVHLLSAEA